MSETKGVSVRPVAAEDQPPRRHMIQQKVNETFTARGRTYTVKAGQIIGEAGTFPPNKAAEHFRQLRSNERLVVSDDLKVGTIQS